LSEARFRDHLAAEQRGHFGATPQVFLVGNFLNAELLPRLRQICQRESLLL
jgi:hypothetical protein